MAAEQLSRVVRFIISGGLATAANLVLLALFIRVFGFWYLPSSAAAFLLAFAVSFTLQKFWTFRDRTTDRVHLQAGAYFGILVINLLINTALVYGLVEYARLWPLVAQALASLLIACESFFLYRIVFRHEA